MKILDMITDWFKNKIYTKEILSTLNKKPPEKKILFISQYDDLIKKYSAREQIPWQLVTALIWQESRFDTKSVSSANCKGLMQLAPCVYEPANIDPFIPEQNIRIGCNHLKTMWGIFKEEKNLDRWKFALASYNCGVSYVCDAQKIAIKNNIRADLWCYVSVFLKDTIFKGKKCIWTETLFYVDIVIKKMYEYIYLDLKNGGGEN